MTSDHGSARTDSGSKPGPVVPAAERQGSPSPSRGGSSDVPSRGAASAASGSGPTLTGRATAAVMCPFLATESGAWRAAFPVGEHRCTAVVPAVRIAPAKQRRLCLSADHLTCATYVAALELRGAAAERIGDPRGPGAGRHRAIPVTTPVLLERIRPPLPIPATMQRGVGQIVLVALLAVAFVAVFFARLGGAPGTSPSPSASAVAHSSASPSAAPSPTVTPGLSPSPSPSPSTSTQPSRTPRPSARPSPSGSPRPSSGTYTVQSGDSLSGVAAKFGTTVKALAALNGLTGPPYKPIHPGQVLKIP